MYVCVYIHIYVGFHILLPYMLLQNIEYSFVVCIAPCGLFILYIVVVLVAQACPTLWDPIDCSLPGSSVHGILQARILECVAILFSRGSS